MSSSEDEVDKEVINRLGECEVCGANQAKYTCPKCEVKTCCLNCVRIHKQELKCDGIRDRTKFVRIKEFTDTDLLSDYRLLEECARFVHSVKRDEKKKFTRIDKDLPIHLYKLKMAARKRGTVLQFLAQNFTRHSINTTRYNMRSNIIHWRVEWVFPNVESDPVKFVDEKCPEQTRLSKLLDKYLNPESPPFEGSKLLSFYRAAGFSGVTVLLRAEKVKRCAKKFFELDPTETLAENLSGKCIVEFPIIFVVLKDHAINFEIITPEDEFGYEDKAEPKIQPVANNSATNVQSVENKATTQSRQSQHTNGESSYPTKKKFRPLLTEEIAMKKKMEIEKEVREEKKKRPKNLLFTTGYSSEESMPESDDDES